MHQQTRNRAVSLKCKRVNNIRRVEVERSGEEIHCLRVSFVEIKTTTLGFTLKKVRTSGAMSPSISFKQNAFDNDYFQLGPTSRLGCVFLRRFQLHLKKADVKLK